jgi:hypothetical protein
MLRKLISLFSGDSIKEIRISSFLPLMRLNSCLIERPFSILSISPKDNIVDLSKLKSFMQVNETVSPTLIVSIGIALTPPFFYLFIVGWCYESSRDAHSSTCGITRS